MILTAAGEFFRYEFDGTGDGDMVPRLIHSAFVVSFVFTRCRLKLVETSLVILKLSRIIYCFMS